jgi:protein required for attachment to host cells
MKPTTTWILIADGARGRLFANRGPGKGLELLDENLDADHRATHDIVDDRLGRTYESAGESRHAISPRHDPHRELKRDFAVRLAKMLDQRWMEHAYDRLVLVAPPSALGDLREALSDHVRGLVRAELDKDLTKTPVAELPGHLAAVLAV